MSNKETLDEAIRLLKTINCPEPILDALWLFSLTVHDDYIKLENWNAWSNGQLIEGESESNLLIEPISEVTPCLPVPDVKNTLHNV